MFPATMMKMKMMKLMMMYLEGKKKYHFMFPATMTTMMMMTTTKTTMTMMMMMKTVDVRQPVVGSMVILNDLSFRLDRTNCHYNGELTYSLV